MPGPLDGFRVLELTTTVSGPMAVMMLADQGADVVKIEPPMIGDSCRYLGSQRGGVGALFTIINRNKQSVALDLKDEAQREIFLQIADSADALVENYRAGVMDRLGIGWDVLSKRNPRLVYVSITGYGQSGPYRDRRVYDPLIQATAGAIDAQGQGEPAAVRTIMFDKVTALTAAQTVTAALLQRERTGRGQFLSVSMIESALSYYWPDVMWTHTFQGDGVTHVGELADMFPIFRCKDGLVQLILLGDGTLELLSVWRGSEIHLDPRFAHPISRVAHDAEFRAAVDEILADVTAEEICEAMDAFGIPAAKVNRIEDVHADPQVKHLNALVETVHPAAGAMRMPRPAVEFDEQSVKKGDFPERPAPAIGADTRAVLEPLGVTNETIQGLEERDRALATQLAGLFAGADAASSES